MLSFTALFSAFALFILLVVSGLTYKMKGWKVALIAGGATFIVIAVLFVVAIYAITSAM